MGGSWPLKAGRGLCVRCGRALALCALSPTAKKIQNSRHKRTSPANTALRSRAARARRMCRRAAQEARARLAGVRRERGVGVSDPELRQHAETPVVVKAAAIVAEAAVPTRGHTTATASEPSRMALREECAERRGTARTRRPLDVRGHLVRTPCCARENVPDSSMRRLRPAGTRRAQPRWINLGARHKRGVT